ncbi:MAG: ABC transporter ATP-binding protein [Polynucleobacter sp.]|uniref:ABC transporter ATP-binding protein n=1 Tax=Polynucleobacter sp. TaxID=2029855 RepID=UPI002725BA83|nr:ABC transporter ATP-binding protein [Polynucleobacter sp.]MDO8713780.1 ABC transporter ATP-binding protein [Polynucleobacter sp.]
MIFGSFSEIASIGLVLPFLTALTAPERVFGHALAQPLIDVLSLTEPKQLLLPITVAFVVGTLFAALTRWILLWAQTKVGHSIGADLSISIYRRTLFQPYSVHASRNSSEVIAGIATKANGVVQLIIVPLLGVLSAMLMLMSILFALLAVEPVIAVAAFGGFGAIYAVIISISRAALARDSRRISHESNMVVKAVQEGLGGIRDVLIDGTQSVYCDIYRNADLPLRRATANIAIIGASPRYAIEALGMVLIAVLAYYMANRPAGIAGAIPVLGALALGAQRLLPLLQQAYAGWTSVRGGQASLNDALDMLDQPLPDYAVAPKTAPMEFTQCIALHGLSFRYASQSPWVLRGLDLEISKGSRVGFIGATGSGKSTLLDIIMGLLQPTEGDIAIDGVRVTSQNHRSWQAHIAHVPQSIFLSDSTLAENIAFGVPKEQIDQSRIRLAAQQAQISDVIESWEMQYETAVGERGVRLSGGQRQRIGIARALYKQADVIVFDEATSALDGETERGVMESIEKLSMELTVLIVAHRLTTLKGCSHVVELADGKVKRVGTYQEIIQGLQ